MPAGDPRCHGRRPHRQDPASTFDALATEGLYGLTAPVEVGGVGPPRFDVIADVVSTLAGGCLATTFVWIQHLGPVMAIRAATELMLRTGSRSVLTDQQAGRIYREAGFLLVFGSRPAIKQAMLDRLRG